MADIDHTLDAIRAIVEHVEEWSKEYVYSPLTNEFAPRDGDSGAALARVRGWFDLGAATPGA